MTTRSIRDRYRDAAKRHYHEEGEIEIDANAEVSQGSTNGAYVQAWIWIGKEELDSDGDA